MTTDILDIFEALALTGCTSTRDHAKIVQNENDLSMPRRAIMHDQRSAEVTGTARNTGQSIVQRPEPVPARAAASPFRAQALGLTCLLEAAKRFIVGMHAVARRTQSLYLTEKQITRWAIFKEG
eukprot:6174086-Pleurochrysis_carterae.AAC.2